MEYKNSITFALNHNHSLRHKTILNGHFHQQLVPKGSFITDNDFIRGITAVWSQRLAELTTRFLSVVAAGNQQETDRFNGGHRMIKRNHQQAIYIGDLMMIRQKQVGLKHNSLVLA